MKLLETIKEIPKAELHCHLDGSIPVGTLFKMVKKQESEFTIKDIDEFRKYVTISGECKSLKEYLYRFDYPIKVLQTKENLEAATMEILEAASSENVRYIELRFAPLFHLEKGLSPEEVVEAVLEGKKQGEEKYNIACGIILCAMRHMDCAKSTELVELANKFKDKGVVAVDLAGNEEDFPPELHKQAFELAKKYGIHITIHAGETGRSENIIKSIKELYAERIGHGTFAYKDKAVEEYLKVNAIPLEVCPTSNVQTKAVDSIKNHPLKRYIEEGLKITLNTDNRTVSKVTLSEEYVNVMEQADISFEQVIGIMRNTIEAGFCSKEVKDKILAEFESSVKDI